MRKFFDGFPGDKYHLYNNNNNNDRDNNEKELICPALTKHFNKIPGVCRAKKSKQLEIICGVIERRT